MLITPDGGDQMEVYGILTTDLPKNDRGQEKLFPASGTLAGKEKVYPAALNSTDITIDALYDKANFLAVLALSGLALDLVITVSDADPSEIVYTCTGSMKTAGQTKVDAKNRMHCDYVFTIDAGWTAA